MEPTLLDLRDLPAPEPLLRALAAIDAIAPGARLCLLTPMLPLPLLEILRERGLAFSTAPCGDGGFQVVVGNDDGAAGA